MDTKKPATDQAETDATESPLSPPLPLSPAAGLGASVYTTTGSAASDLRLVRRAIRERWPIPEDVRPRAVAALVGVIDHPSSLPTDRIRAVRTLVAMDAENVKATGEGNVLGQAARLAEAIVQLGRGASPAQLSHQPPADDGAPPGV